MLIGAPLFMEKTEGGRTQEVGRVYLYLQQSYGMDPSATAVLNGHQEFGRFGSAIAPLGDLNQDGYHGMEPWEVAVVVAVAEAERIIHEC